MDVEWPSNVKILRVKLAVRCVCRVTDPLDLTLAGKTLPAELEFTLLAGHYIRQPSSGLPRADETYYDRSHQSFEFSSRNWCLGTS